MKKVIIILIFLISHSGFSQSDRILFDYPIDTHKDSLSTSTVNEFITMSEDHKIDYEDAILKIKEVRSVERKRDFVNGLKDGVIFLNKRLDSFPYTKRVAILQMLYVNNGGRISNNNKTSVFSYFYVTDHNEDLFKRQKEYKSTLYYLRERLIDESPLKRRKWLINKQK